jgi:hypothetical protein
VNTPHKRKARRRNWKAWDSRTAVLGNAALAEIRMSREPEPRMVRWHRFRIRVYDDLTGESHQFRMTSLRDVMRRLSVMLRYYD